MVRPSQAQTGPPVPCRWQWWLLWFFVVCQHRTVDAVSGIYVNNQRLEKETDSWQLLRPTVAAHEVSKGELLTKANFSESGPTASWINLYWDRNGNHSATQPGATPVQYADEVSSIKNTLHDAYVGDDFRPATVRPSSKPTMLSTVTGFPSTTATPTTVKLKHKHHKTPRTTRKPPATASPTASVIANKSRTELAPELMALLQRYYSFSCTLVPKQTPVNSTTRRTTRIRTHTTQRPTRTSTTTTMTTSASSKPTKRRSKPTPATVYVDPPVIKRLGGMLESVYNFMESALTSTEIDRRASTNEPPMVPRKVKRNTGAVTVSVPTTTEPSAESRTDSEEAGWKRFTGADRVTIAGLPAMLSSTGTDGNKNKMTTNIQVTSEYTAATPATVPLKKPNRGDDDDDDEDSSESDDSADYYGGFDDDDDDDEDDDEDDEDGGEDEAIQPNRRRRPSVSTNDKDYDGFGTDSETGDRRPIRKRRRRRKPPATSYENSDEDRSSYEDDDDDDDDEEVEYSAKDDRSSEEEEDEPPASGFFAGMFATFSRFVRSLGFGGPTFRGGDYDEDRGRSTTPRVLAAHRRPTRSTTDHLGSSTATVPSRHVPPFPPYLFNVLDDTDVAVEEELDHEQPTPSVEPSSASSWFDLMMPSWDVFNPWGSEEPSEAAPTQQGQVEESGEGSSSSWGLGLGQWFGGGDSTTTEAPKTTTSGPAAVPEQLLSALTQYVVHGQVASTTTRPPRKRRSYAGYQLWRLAVQNAEQLHSLIDYRRSPAGLELRWWIGPSVRGLTDVLVPGAGPAQSQFREYLRDEGIGYETTIRDVGRAIAYENPRMTRRDQIETELLHGHPMTWYRYHRYADIVKFLGTLHRHHGHRVQLLHIGRSYEGRPLTVVRVSFAQPAARVRARARAGRRPHRRRPAIFIEAGVQGRDWIGPAVATWLLNRLVELPLENTQPVAQANGTEDGGLWETVQSYDWYVMPVLNPDGYEYSHEHDRMWAKSRGNASDDDDPEQGVLASALSSWWPMGAATDDGSERRCIGVNLDRNWGHRWGQGAGASRSKCSEDYAGPAPFSEPETRSLRDFLLGGGGRSRRNLRLYLSLRSYGQALSYPTERHDEVHREEEEDGASERDEDVHEMASVGLDALRGSGAGSDHSEQYRLVAGISTVGGAASGTAVEYARYGAGIRYAYTLRLPDSGTHGFLLPPSNIVATGRDLFELIKGMIEYN